MKERSASSIQQDMLAIGLDAETAKKIAAGAGLKDQKAESFADDNFDLVDLTVDQETGLLCDILPNYEANVKAAINVDLTQYQFDALVSFAYNPGGRMNNVAHLINAGKIPEAMAEIKKANTSKGKVMKGLVTRREGEVKLFLEGDYGKLHEENCAEAQLRFGFKSNGDAGSSDPARLRDYRLPCSVRSQGI